MKYITKVFLLCLGMIVSISVFGQDKKLLWEISDEDSVVYLIGTVHALEWDDYPLDYLYEEAYRVADRVVFETNLSSFSEEDLEDFTQQNGLYPQGQTIKSHVSNETYNILRDAAQEQGLDLSEVVKIKPWVWILSFSAATIELSDLDSDLGVDQHFLEKAERDNKQLLELETWADQIKIFSEASLDKQGKYLDGIIIEFDSSVEDTEDTADAWRASDLSELDDLVVKMKKRDEYAYNRLIKDRNNKWVPKIFNYLNMPGTTTVFAGAAHFAGEDSVINLLSSKGHAVKRLPEAPRLLVNPSNDDQILEEGSSLVISYEFRSLYPISYMWFHNDRIINGENGPSLRINSLKEEDSGSYVIKAINKSGSTTTMGTQLKVMQKPKPPEITLQPLDVTVGHGENAVFTVSAEGAPNLKYQWYKNGVQIEEATLNVLRINNVSKEDETFYSVRVKNEYGKVVSGVAQLTVIAEPPLILTQPESQVVNLGENVEFVVSASGVGLLEYQWYKNGVQIEEATLNVLRINNVSKEDETIYSVRVKNQYGKAVSGVAQLTVIAEPPTITSQPKDIKSDLGGIAEFSVAVKGSKPFDIQWYKNGQVIEGANKLTLSISPVNEADYTIYSVRIRNSVGKVVSEMVRLKAFEDPVVLKVNSMNSFPFTISFKTSNGSTYALQASSDLNKWSSLQEIEGTGNEVKVTDWREAIFQKQYYRVKLVD